MSTVRVNVLRITFLSMAVTCLAPLMALADDPYVSEFEFASRFHPSRNPDCGWEGTDEERDNFHGSDFEPLRARRSPEEGPPVGQEPSIEVRAILVRCPKNEEEADDVLIDRNVYNITAGRSQDILEFRGFGRDEPARHSEVRDCRRKLIITMKFNNIGRTKTQEEFVVIDHVLDPVTMHKSRLLNPFVVKVRQEPVLQLYGLKFRGVSRDIWATDGRAYYRLPITIIPRESRDSSVSGDTAGSHLCAVSSMIGDSVLSPVLRQQVVNAEAREEVISKKMSNYTGCDDVSENPTCGQMFFDGKPIPYSHGFCCSCDPELNVQRESSLSNDSAIRSFSSFFSKSKSGPSKSPRSVRESFLDDLSDLDKTFHKETAKNVGHLGDPDNVNVDHDHDLFADDHLAPAKNVQDDERDLIGLKNANKFSSRSPVEPRERIDHPADSREFPEHVNENIPNYRRTESRTESFHHPDRVNLTAALTKLEQDYKNLRLSNLMRAAGRSNENKMTARQKLQPGGRHSSQGYVLTSPYPGIQGFQAEEGSHGRLPTLSIDVLLAIRPKQDLTSPIHSTLLTSCPTVEPTTGPALESSTPAVLRQKLVSDRVYPSIKEAVFNKIDEGWKIGYSSSREVTTDSSPKFGTVKGQENVAKPYSLKVFDNAQSGIDRPGLEKMYNATSPTNSTTTSGATKTDSTSTSIGSARNLREPTQSFDNLSGQVESPANSSSSFSSGSHAKGDAIPPSGSLKNQLANWFTGRWRKSRRRTGRKKSGKDDAEVGETGYNGEVGSLEVAVPTPATDNDRWTTSIEVRNPVRVHFEPDRSYDNGKPIHKTREADGISPDYSDSEGNDVQLSSKSGPTKGSRSYRSVSSDNEAFINKDDDQQRSIDKKIEDEFEVISEALKDAADASKVIRGRPSGGSAFENDDSVIEKYEGNWKRDQTSGNHENQTQSVPVKHTEAIDEPVSELPLTTGHRIVVDRFKVVKNFQDLPESYKQTTFVGPKTRHLDTSEGKMQPGSEMIPTPLPIPMIENLKKELREEAQRYSSPGSPLRTASMNPKDLQGHSHVNEMREANTELTPAERVEDLVTDEETLPPDEETTLTAMPLNWTTIIPRNVNESVTKQRKMNHELPRVAFQVLEQNLLSERHAIPSKTTDKVLILVEEASKPSETSLHRRSKKTHKKRHHRRHHHRRIGRHRRRSIEAKQNGTHDVGSTGNGQVTNGRSQNEDDEHPWYETTINGNRENATTSRSEVTEPARSTDSNRLALKNLKRRDLPLDTTDESPNKAETVPSPGKLYVSLSRIPESDHHSKLAGLRVEEIPKVEPRVSEATIDPYDDESKTPMMNSSSLSELSEAPGQVDEVPIFRATESPSNDDDSKSRKTVIKEVQKRNDQTPSTSKFRSLYPKSSEVGSMSDAVVDEATASEDVGRNNKRGDLTKPDENDPEGLIFYDYDAIDEPAAPVTEDSNDENKRSLKNGDLEFKSNARLGGAALMDRKYRRSMNSSGGSSNTSNGDEYQIEPSSGWKEKMELLKLKKHSDVLKEYLNWRHDIVPPEPHEISGYTTKISMTNEKEGTAKPSSNVSNETTLSNTFVTPFTVTDAVSTVSEDQKTSTTMMSRINEDVTKQTEMSGSTTSLPTSTAASHSGNCSINESNTAVRIETTTGYLNQETTVTEESTGRILPPCCHTLKEAVTTCPTGLQANVDCWSSRPHVTSPKVTSGRRGQLSDVENDLVIISIMEKNRLANKNHGDKIVGKTDLVSHHRRYRPKKKIRHSPSGVSKKAERRAGRHLMSVQDSEYEEDDLMFDNLDENVDNLKSSVDGDALNDQDGETLKNKWNQLIDKVIHNSSEFWKPANSTESSLLESTRGDHRSAMKEMHFINANKYIKQMARKIAHSTNFHDPKHDLDAFDDKNRPRKLVTFGRKLKSHPRLANKAVRKVSVKDSKDVKDPEDPIDPVGHTQSIPSLKTEGQSDSSAVQPNPTSRDADSNVPEYQESSDQDQSGRDFAISLSGKIHVEGGTNGRPMSISFDTSPEMVNRNETLQGGSDGTSDLDSSTNTESSPSSNFLSSIFNIASAPKNLHSQEANGNPGSSESELKSGSPIVATDSQPSSENDQRTSPRMVKKSVIRRSRAVGEGTDGRLPTNRADRSFDLEDSQDLKDIPEESEVEDYPDSAFAYNDDPEYEEADDSQDSDFNQRPNVEAPDVKVLKIIPLTISRSSTSSEVRGRGSDDWQGRKEDTKASRMTASQLPKMEDDLVPGTTFRPGKIRPAMLPWQENGDDKMLVPNMDNSKASKSCSPTSDSGGPDKDAFDEPRGPVSTKKPVSLKVVGLVSMEQPAINLRKNPKDLLDDNYEIVPLIHVKIEQQPDGRGNLDRTYHDNRVVDDPSGPMEGCPKLEMTKSRHRFRGNSCSDMNNQDDSNQPEVATMNMDNDEELREPIGRGSCPDSSNSGGPTDPNFVENDRSNRIRPIGYRRNLTTSERPSFGIQNVRNEARKRIRLKNMLAIMEFVSKIRGIMTEEETRNGPVDVDETTDRFVVMGEGVKHGRPQNGVNASSLNPDRFNESRSDTSNWKSQKDQDKSFLFSNNNDKVEGAKQAVHQDPKYRDSPSIDSVTDRPNEGSEGQETSKSPNEGSEGHETSKNPNEVPRDNNELPTKLTDPEANESTAQTATNSPVVNPNDSSNVEELPEEKNPQRSSESQERNVLEKLQRKINDRLRGLKRANRDRNETQAASLSTRKRQRSVSDDFPSIPKIKRHRLRSPRGRVSPTGGEVSRLGRQKFRRLAAGVSREKRRRKKKKKTKRRKKKKKKKKMKKHRKKGKSLRDAEIKGKTWWPFGRQLMSLSDDQIQDVDQIREAGSRGVSSEVRERRRVHRAKFPRGKRRKTKKRKHKKAKRRRKKKKGKKTKTTGTRTKRQIRPSGTQVRGGQDCLDRRHPPNVNAAKYLESAHCLRFSDLWYSAYELENPIMEHTVYLQLFEKHNRADGTARWEDLTQGSMVAMGTFTKHQRDSKPTIVFTYSGAKIEPQNRALNLDPTTDRLLIPSPVSPKKANDYPEVRDGSGEYLVVKASAISKDGDDCDKAGVGFAAFSKQQNRCGRPEGSCLRNQPLAYWRHDMKARESGRRGCYFLSNFAAVPRKPIKYNVSGSGSREYLGLEYHSAHVSAIDIQVRSDYNAIVRVGSSGRVTEVHVDSTAPEHTVVTVVISNMGLASSPYQPRIADCPAGLPVSWTKAKGIMQVIPPQRDQRVTLDLYGQLLLNGFHCSVEVVNHRGELVAMRRIRVQRMDRCFCVWHCLCACIGSVSGMGCQPMSPEHYHAAGFQGPVPVVTAETSVLVNAVKNVLMLSALLVLLLLVLGMLKWLVGMFAPAVGRWGLDSLLEDGRIESYLEPELRCRCVMTDDYGWPVHPDTGRRTVRVCSRKLEFVLNLIFFLTYPMAVCCTYFKRSLNSSRQRRCCPDESKTCLINDKGSCPKMICVSTYGDRRDTKLEAEDTRYVMSELKKSRESLQNPKRSKGDKSDPKNLTKKSSHKNKSASEVSAKRLVDDLLKSRMVFRNLTEPIGGLRVPAGVAYSLRGYFLNAEDGGYRFITPCPFKQHWLIENDQKTMLKLPETYPSNLFMRSFGTARDVYESNELSLSPKGICINVQYQDDT